MELLQLTKERLQVLISNPQLIRDEYPEGSEAGQALLRYRLTVQQDLPTRLKHLYSWNLNSWSIPDHPLRDPKTRKCQRLLMTGPLCLQETKWDLDLGVPEKVAGYLPGTKIFSTPAILLDSGKRSGGVSVLLPPGWKAEKVHELVPSRALAVRVRDRPTCFYLVSVYLHPASKKRDLEKLMQEWTRLEKDTSRVIFVGDFNRIDETDPTQWNSFLTATGSLDVDPKLVTYYSQMASSALDPCLMPADWVASASWNPSMRTLHPTSSTGHKILRIVMQLRPSVVNNPKDPKHDILPSDLFMPGKHPSIAKQTDIQVLLRLLHREMQQSVTSTEWFQSLTFAIAPPTYLPSPHSPCADSLDRALLEWDGLNRSAHPNEADYNHTEQSSLSKYTSQHFSFSSCFWAWWRTQEVPKANPAIAPYLLARKYLRGTQQWVNIPVWIIEDLIKQTRGAVLQSVEHLPVIQGSCSRFHTKTAAPRPLRCYWHTQRKYQLCA